MVLLILKSSACFTVFYLMYLLLLRREKHFRLNRLVLIVTLVASTAIPLIDYTHYATVTKTVFTEATTNSQPVMGLYVSDEVAKPIATNSVSEVTVKPRANLKVIAIAVYLGVVGILLVYLAYQLLTLFFQIKRCKNSSHINGQRVIISNRWRQTFSFFRVIVMTDYDFHNPNRNLLVEHELVHARQLHSFDLLLAEIFAALHWFNPLVYFYKKSLCEVHEFLADGRVVNSGTDAITYQQLILHCASASNAPIATNSFSAKLLKNRIAMINKDNFSNSTFRYLMIVPVLMGLLALFSFKVEKRVNYIYKTKDPIGIILPDDDLYDINDIELKDESSKEFEFPSKTAEPDKISLSNKEDSTILYNRLNQRIDESFSRIITVYQKETKHVLFNSMYFGDEVDLWIAGTSLMKNQPLFEIRSQETGLLIEPTKHEKTKEFSLYYFKIPKMGDYKISITNIDAIQNFLYTLAIPKEKNFTTEVGINVNEKRVLLRNKKAENLHQVTLQQANTQIDSATTDSIKSAKQRTKTIFNTGKRKMQMQKGNEGDLDFQALTINYPSIEVPIESVNLSNIDEGNMMKIASMDGNWPQSYLQENINYPKSFKPKRRKAEVVEVTFILSESGSISNVVVTKGVNPDLDAEVVRVLSGMTDWEIETVYKVPVPVEVTLRFALGRK